MIYCRVHQHHYFVNYNIILYRTIYLPIHFEIEYSGFFDCVHVGEMRFFL